MGKISVDDLATMMGVTHQDLVFKLKSIGVRVEGEDAAVDMDVLQGILAGKSLPHPREVILRDEEAEAPPSTPSRRVPLRRAPVNPLRPTKRRTIIQKVEPRIKSIPVTERPEPERRPSPAPPSAKTPSGPQAGEIPSAVAQKGEAATTAEEATSTRRVSKKTRGEGEAEERKVKRTKKSKESQSEEDLRAYRGSLDEIEASEEEAEKPVAGRRRRRTQRKKQQAEEGGKVLSFRKEGEGPVTITEGMTVREFSDKLGVKSKELMSLLFQRGLMVNINHVLDTTLAKDIADELGIDSKIVSFEEELQIQHEQESGRATGEGTMPRPPVVTIMGHVDHGKTTLLDAIRSSKVVESEHGGITQHIGAYSVEVNGKKIVFLDTPGHEAFTLMRARGAQATDIVVLVVAADDGVMPQTVEAIDHARAAGVPIVVAINKIDKPNAKPDRVKKELSDHGLVVEDWGGDVVSVEISAKKKQGLDSLLEMVLLTADLLELKADPDLPAQGVIVEAQKEVGRGNVATVLVQNGTLRVGDVFVSGAVSGRVRVMTGDQGQRINEALPATPVEVAGFGELPEAGDSFQVVEEEAKARSIADFRKQERRKNSLAPNQAKVSLDQLFQHIQEGAVKELPVVLKADVQGSVEVLSDALAKASTDKVKVKVIRSGVGAITANDVLLASASGAIVFGFNVRPERDAVDIAEREEVDIRLHTVIYEITDELKKAMTGLLEPTFKEVSAGVAEVREIFKVPKVGTIAGCHVVEGAIPRTGGVRLIRDGRVVYEGKIASLKRFKEDVSEVRSGFDCGIGLDRYQDVKPGDSIEAFVSEEVAPSL